MNEPMRLARRLALEIGCSRSEAQQYSPNTWQMTLGIVLLLIILFLPRGLWSLFTLRRRGA